MEIMMKRRPTSWIYRLALLGCTLTLLGSVPAEASEVMGMVAVPGQENRPVPIESSNVTLFNESGWICNATYSNDPGKVTAICRYNNEAPAVASVVSCDREKMKNATLILMNQLSQVATIALVCNN